MQRTKRGANFNAEIFQHQFAYLIAVDPVGSPPQHVIHFVPQVAGLEPHRRMPFSSASPCSLWRAMPLSSPLGGSGARTRAANSAEVASVWWLRRSGPSNPSPCRDRKLSRSSRRRHRDGHRCGSLLNAAAAADDLFHPRAEGDGRGAGRTAVHFCIPADTASSCRVGFQRVTAERRGGVGIEQHIVTTANLPAPPAAAAWWWRYRPAR